MRITYETFQLLIHFITENIHTPQEWVMFLENTDVCLYQNLSALNHLFGVSKP